MMIILKLKLKLRKRKIMLVFKIGEIYIWLINLLEKVEEDLWNNLLN